MSMRWETLWYALACVLVPVAWGIVVVWASNRIERRLFERGAHKRGDRRTVPPIEYHI